ncbi:hypothetical protein [Niastella caeni]|uniref:hypothetical protein n=1 Tax=Niastella caeni TaxID=2569763 RepID=UPI00129BDEE8|nr:hypothetical protein [Niastella caeni]
MSTFKKKKVLMRTSMKKKRSTISIHKKQRIKQRLWSNALLFARQQSIHAN